MIGIKAMSVIADATGNSASAVNYSSIATDYITKWQTLGINHDANPPHSTLAYGANDTWGLLYNLLGDKELGLNFVPQSVYDMQSNFYPTVNAMYGVPLDTRHTYTKGAYISIILVMLFEVSGFTILNVINRWLGILGGLNGKR